MHTHFNSCRAALSLTRVCAVALRAASRWRAAGNLLLALSATGAQAEMPAARPASWVCWYADGTSLACRLGPEGLSMLSPADLSAGAEDSAIVPPAGRRPLPEIVRTILLQPEKLAGRTISIPLFTEAQDMDFARELAEAVMCGTRRLCRVLFLGSSAEVALALDAVDDPALN